jgi:Tol biopolymer transport system component
MVTPRFQEGVHVYKRSVVLPILTVSALVIGCSSSATAPVVSQPTVLHNSIVFYSTRQPAGLYTMRADGSSQALLTTQTGAGDGVHVSPDGTRLLLTIDSTVSNPGGPPFSLLNVAVMNLDGSGLTQLTQSAAGFPVPTGFVNTEADASGGASAAWSPDGKKIVFTAARDGYQPSLFTMNADGSGQTRLTTNPATDSVSPSWDLEPAWSPDGQTIVFYRLVETRQAGIVLASLMTIRPDGSSLASIPGLDNQTAADPEPSWSPDSRRLAFDGVVNGQYGLVVSNADGSAARIVVSGPLVQSPSWAPDGQSIAYEDLCSFGCPSSGNPNPDFQIFSIAANGGGAAQQLTTVDANSRPVYSPLP